ncbi:MAG: LysM peptidoglycan-binding domain-containing protein [Spirosomataceae bacterium]
MEFEKRRNHKNPPPAEGSSTLPKAVLAILLGIIVLLLFIGWQYLNDTPSNAEEMIPTQPDVVSAQMEEADDAAEYDDKPSQNLPDISLPSSGVATDENTVPEEAVVSKPEPIISNTNTGEASHTHKVASGETFYSIANRYNVSVSTLKSYNSSVDPSNIKVNITKITVPVQAIHTVGPGDILRVVAKKYDVSLQALMKANGRTKNSAQRGEKLVIPFSTQK